MPAGGIARVNGAGLATWLDYPVRVAHRHASAWHGPVTGAFSSLDQAIAWLQA